MDLMDSVFADIIHDLWFLIPLCGDCLLPRENRSIHAYRIRGVDPLIMR